LVVCNVLKYLEVEIAWLIAGLVKAIGAQANASRTRHMYHGFAVLDGETFLASNVR